MAKISKAGALAIGLGATAVAAAAAYFLTGERGEKNRKKIKAWAEEAKNELVKELKGLKQVSKDSYAEMVDEVVGRYKATKGATPRELSALKKELKAHWRNITKHVAGERAEPKKAK